MRLITSWGLEVRGKLIGASLLAIAVAQGNAGQARAQASGAIEEVVVTAQKRSEKLQKVPQSIQVLDSKKLAQLHVTEFQDYIKYIPSLTTQSGGPNMTTIYLRGVVDGGNANHSGPLPTVGSYVDDMPTTTIGGTLDVHLYDIARVEVLAGPQGTLYGASSEAGTVRFITNQPNTAKFEAGYTAQVSSLKSGELGSVAEGFVNIPINDKVAVRLVGFDEHDPGYIDNVLGSRTYRTSGTTITNAGLVSKGANPADSFGGRAALRVDLNEDWTVTPQVMYQDQRTAGSFGFEPSVGDLKVQRFGEDYLHDRWVQAGLNITGKIGDYTLTYAGGFFVRDEVTRTDYTDYSIFYDKLLGSGAYWTGANGQPLSNPSQYILGRDHFTKENNEIRVASPKDDRISFIAGVFQQEQGHHIVQDYTIPGFSPDISVPGHYNTIWLTNQQRTDRDVAAFTEVTFHVTDKFSILGGVRPYYYDNGLVGFFGYSANFSSHTGVSQCKPGLTFEGAPCVDLNAHTTGSGETHKISLDYQITPDQLAYFTYSTGFRPGGVNRRANQGEYNSDELINFEVGYKSSWLDHRLTWNTAGYIEDWNNFQFAYLGQNSFTIVKNAPSANIKGLESAIEFRPTSDLTLNAGVTLTDAQLTQDFCTENDFGQVLKKCSYPGTFTYTYKGNVDTTDTVSVINFAKNGASLPYSPAVKGFATARYTFQFADWDGYLQGDVSYHSREQAALRSRNPYVPSVNSIPNDTELLGSIPSAAVFGVTAGVSRGNLNFDVFIKNLGDSRDQETRYTACTVEICASKVPGIPQSVYAVPITPFTAGFRISQKF